MMSSLINIAVIFIKDIIQSEVISSTDLEVKQRRIKNMSDLKLSLEQQFNLRSFATEVEKMNREQAQDFLVRLYEEMLVRENLYKDTLKYQWQLE